MAAPPSQVVAFVAEVDDVLALLADHPEMEGVVQQICAQQRTDMMVADAMRQLRLSFPPPRQHSMQDLRLAAGA